jgi:hypothetical protein
MYLTVYCGLYLIRLILFRFLFVANFWQQLSRVAFPKFVTKISGVILAKPGRQTFLLLKRYQAVVTFRLPERREVVCQNQNENFFVVVLTLNSGNHYGNEA